tara:strand:- start:743 stop:2479 length:1737 start_codon:yes stop_codon:yes gene_type:complete
MGTVRSERTLIAGGPVLTMNPAQPTADAVLIEDGVLIAVGDAANLGDMAGADAKRIDLAGAVLMPGLIDSHPHLLHFASLTMATCQLFDARDHADIVARIKNHCMILPPDQWAICSPVGEPHYFIRRGWRDLAEGVLPDRYVLDRAAPDRPVIIQAWAPVTPNIAVLNSAALRAVGISSDTPDQVGGVRIVKDKHGEPTGHLEGPVNNYYSDDPFWLSILGHIGAPPDWLWEAGALNGLAAYNALGVTGGYESHAMEPAHIEAYRKICGDGRLTMRIAATMDATDLTFDPTKPTDEATVLARLALAKSWENRSDTHFRFNGITLARGGPCWPGYLRQHKAYPAPDGTMTNGKAFVPREIELIVLRYCLEHDLRFNMVLGGDKDADELLQSLAETTGGMDTAALDWVVQHVLMLTAAQCKRIAEFGFHVTTSPGFVWGKGALYRERLGAAALDDFVPARRLMELGANLAFGSDWGPDNPFEQMQMAETQEFCVRGACSHTPAEHRAHHQVTRMQALNAYTRNAARVMQWEGIGAIKAGYAADLIVVDGNPLTCPVEKLSELQVQLTLLGGKPVFDRGVI